VGFSPPRLVSRKLAGEAEQRGYPGTALDQLPVRRAIASQSRFRRHRCKLNSVDPSAWLSNVLTKLVNLWPASRIDELMPRANANKSS
jgi:hypothetical protein